MVVVPIRRSWRAVLTYYQFRGVEYDPPRQERTLLIVVGCTSADGNEKSQYREKVFCHGVKWVKYISYQQTWAHQRRRTGWGKVEYLM